MGHVRISIHASGPTGPPSVRNYRMGGGISGNCYASYLLGRQTLPDELTILNQTDHDSIRFFAKLPPPVPSAKVEKSSQSSSKPATNVLVVTDDDDQGDADSPPPAGGDGVRQRCEPCVQPEQCRRCQRRTSNPSSAPQHEPKEREHAQRKPREDGKYGPQRGGDPFAAATAQEWGEYVPKHGRKPYHVGREAVKEQQRQQRRQQAFKNVKQSNDDTPSQSEDATSVRR